MTWAEERRANRAAEAEQARLNADAAAERRIRERAARVELARTAAEAEQASRAAAKQAARARRTATLGTAGRWLVAHQVQVPIYLLAVASAVMAVPSMGLFGWSVYGNATGGVLPLLSELGMWAFALAVEVSRRRHPARPVWALQLGVYVFAGIAFGLNVLHGLDRGWSAAAVMGVVSVAGVLAHQLAVASPRRSAAERAAARIERETHRKVTRIRRAAVRHAVAAIDPAGTVRLEFTAGRYVLDRRGRLVEAIPPADAAPAGLDPARHAAGVLVEEIEAHFRLLDRAQTGEQDRPHDAGPVATLDPPAEQQKSSRKPRRIPEPKRRTIAQLRAEFAAALADPDGRMDPTSAESIRKTLRVAPKTARQLRDEHKTNTNRQ